MTDVAPRPSNAGLETAIIGHRYIVSAEDCCVSVEFTATLIAMTPVQSPFPEDQGMIEDWTFDNGVVIHGGVVRCSPVDDQPAERER